MMNYWYNEKWYTTDRTYKQPNKRKEQYYKEYSPPPKKLQRNNGSGDHDGNNYYNGLHGNNNNNRETRENTIRSGFRPSSIHTGGIGIETNSNLTKDTHTHLPRRFSPEGVLSSCHIQQDS